VEGNGLIWLTLGLPLLGALLQTALGSNLSKSAGGKRILGFLAVVPIVLAFGIGAKITQSLDPSQAAVVTSVPWIEIAGFSVPFELRIDTLSMTMVLIITGIGALIHLYATGYMADERDYGRFFAYLNLFIAAMLILVLGNNLLLLFIGWEGVGLCSYLLIGFWYKDLANSKAANKAFIVNRIGDWGLTLGLFAIVAAITLSPVQIDVNETRLLSYDVILPALATISPAQATIIALLLFVGACGKSAQFPLYIWLPDAMAGPTPVSALIHAATMVTSGVVLLNRMHVVFEMSPIASSVVVMVGAFTALFAALIAFGQTDIKKVLAYSTVSQLGFMFVACGAGAYWVGMFHVTTHAFFKALLFLGSGAVIHAMAHEQDMRHYGKLAKYIPITWLTMMVGYLAIAGVPGLSGFWSKEAVIGSALAGEHAVTPQAQFGVLAGWICLIVAALTAMYMTRMMWLTFFGKEERWRNIEPTDHGHDEDHHHALDANHKPHEVPVSMSFPLIVLAILSAAGGWYLHSGDRFEKWLSASSVGALGRVSTHPENLPLLQLSVGAAVFGIVAGIIVYAKGLPKKEGLDESQWSGLRKAMQNQFGYDSLLVDASVSGGRELTENLDRGFDTGLIAGVGVGGGKFFQGVGGILRLIQSGFIRTYALVMLIGVIGLATWVLIALSGGGK
jgi:NADH-quinone oxidoreductase subunit L